MRLRQHSIQQALEAAGLSYLIHTAEPFVSVTSMVEKEWPEHGVIHLCS